MVRQRVNPEMATRESVFQGGESMNIRRNTLGLLISTALCLAFLLLEHLGMDLYTITETHTLAALAAIVFGVFALYFAALIATSFL